MHIIKVTVLTLQEYFWKILEIIINGAGLMDLKTLLQAVNGKYKRISKRKI